jgi:hypothetical protein
MRDALWHPVFLNRIDSDGRTIENSYVDSFSGKDHRRMPVWLGGNRLFLLKKTLKITII